VHFGGVAAGEVVLNSRSSTLARRLRRNFGDAIAVEMESAGVALAGHLNRSTPTLTIRAISDDADGTKAATDARGWQVRAAANAAAFAAALIQHMEDGGAR
jgi:8-oxo-dGTP diphosphatase